MVRVDHPGLSSVCLLPSALMRWTLRTGSLACSVWVCVLLGRACAGSGQHRWLCGRLGKLWQRVGTGDWNRVTVWLRWQ